MNPKLAALSVVMVEPRHGLNVGYVARVMKNFGMTKLYVVGEGWSRANALRFASHASDIINNIQLTSFEDVRQRFDLMVGTTAIAREWSRNGLRRVITLNGLRELRPDFSRSAIVLGRDTTGLTNSELALCDYIVHIPTGTAYPTMNVSHALAIMLYVLNQTKSKGIKRLKRRTIDLLVTYFLRMMALSGYPEHKQERATRTFKKMLVQAQLSENEALACAGVYRKTILALNGWQRTNILLKPSGTYRVDYLEREKL